MQPTTMHPDHQRQFARCIDALFDPKGDNRPGVGSLDYAEWHLAAAALLKARIVWDLNGLAAGYRKLCGTSGDLMMTLGMTVDLIASIGWGAQPPSTVNLEDFNANGVRPRVAGWIRQQIAANTAGLLDSTVTTEAIAQFVVGATVEQRSQTSGCALAILYDVLLERYSQSVDLFNATHKH